MTSALESPSDSATSLTVAPELIGVIGGLDDLRGLVLAEVGLDPRCAATPAAAAARWLLLGRRSLLATGCLGVDDHAPAAPAASASATGQLLALAAATLGPRPRRALAAAGGPLALLLRRLRSACCFGAGFASGLAFASGAGFFSSAAGAGASLSAPFENARATSRSSTLEAAAFTSRPARWSTAMTSFEGIPFSFAISCTRFFAMNRPILGFHS